VSELPESVHAQIRDYCAQGDEAAGRGEYQEALDRYNAAFALVPEPRTDWHASTWIMGAIGDACFTGGYFTTARTSLEYAMHCPDGLGNPFLHLRLGQTLFEQGDCERAADELMRAFMGAGDEIFAAEDPKYRAFLATRAKLD
tara:strand:- start:41 stop:469 length:429 start_codon:yes stop_codon:yes gene_type:complete